MLRSLPSLLVPLLLLVLPARAATDGLGRNVLRSLAAVESGDDPRVIGRLGERSRWQFMERTWRAYTQAPFARASTDEVLARIVAETHLRMIISRLRRQGRPVTVKNIARCWNPGAPADYAQRVSNLANLP